MADPSNRGNGLFGVYVHWPFCAAKCPYCDFNSHVRHKPVDQARWAEAFATEIAAMGRRVPGRTVGSIFLGGGTPSLMEPKTVGAILDAMARAGLLDQLTVLPAHLVAEAAHPDIASFLGHADREKAGRAMAAMMTMRKLDIAAIEAAFNGETV